MKYWQIYSAAILAAVLACNARADSLTGTSVTGLLTVDGSPNYFDPANSNPPTNFIPPGYLNLAGSTVTISDSAIEFGAAGDVGGDNLLITSDFTDNQLTVGIQYTIPAENIATTPEVTFQFTDAAFFTFAVTKLSDAFPNGGLSPALSGDVLTLDWPGVTLPISADPQSGQYTAVYALNAVPEPGSALSIGVGLAALLLGVALRRRGAMRAVITKPR